MTKGLWVADPGDALGRTLFDGVLSWPAMVLRRSALEHNIAAMAAYCARNGLEHAPHGKTTMAPALWRRQLDAGAWGITVATAFQAVEARHAGVPRVLLANELLDPAALGWAADQVAAGWEFLCYVDSLAGVDALATALAGRSLSVLVELGFAGGRTGCRDLGSARAVAEAAAAVDGVTVAGVAGFEGMLAEPDELLGFIVSAAETVEDLCPAPLILSAGGSMHFDAVTNVFGPAARDHGWRIILRSGAYVTHDHRVYASSASSGSLGLRPALEVWAQVLSTPEPGLALLGAGKRDVPIDEGMPVPLGVRAADGSYRPLVGAVVDRTNDQHAYLRGGDVTPGDLVKLGISHPCTAFDKWRVIPMADDDDTIVELVETYF